MTDGYEFAKRAVYGGYHMRSQGEVNVARHLDERQIQWRYEPETFFLSNGERYIPDFEIVADVGGLVAADFVEVKTHSDVYPLVKALGLPDNIRMPHSVKCTCVHCASGHAPTTVDAGLAWSARVPVAAAMNSGKLPRDVVRPVRKPYMLATNYRKTVIVVSKLSENAAVVQFNPDGTVQARRHHQLTATRTMAA